MTIPTSTKHTYRVAIQVIEVWHVLVDAEDEAQAEQAAYRQLDATTIRKEGTLVSVETDYAEVLGEQDASG